MIKYSLNSLTLSKNHFQINQNTHTVGKQNFAERQFLAQFFHIHGNSEILTKIIGS